MACMRRSVKWVWRSVRAVECHPAMGWRLLAAKRRPLRAAHGVKNSLMRGLSVRWRLLVVVLAALACGACRRAPKPDPTPSAQRAPEDADAGMSVAPEVPPEGSPLIAVRPIDIGIYLPAAVPAALMDSTEKLARKRFPGVTFRRTPPAGSGDPPVQGDVPPPSALLLAPPIDTFAPPNEAQLAHFGRGLDPTQAAAAAASKGVLVLSFVL